MATSTGFVQNFLAVAAFASMTATHALEPLSDDMMADVTGQESVALNFQFKVNSEMNATTGAVTHKSCPTDAEHSLGTPDCRWGLAFNDLEDTWLVLKVYYLGFRLDRVRLSSERTQNTASGLCDTKCAARFGGASFNDKPVLQLGFDHFGEKSLGEAYYGDAMLYLRAERVMAEFDAGGTEGFMLNDVPGAAVSIRMADGPNGINGAAQMRLDGRMQIYGY